MFLNYLRTSQKIVKGVGVKPLAITIDALELEFVAVVEDAVNVCNLKPVSLRWLYLLDAFNYIIREYIYSCFGKIERSSTLAHYILDLSLAVGDDFAVLVFVIIDGGKYSCICTFLCGFDSLLQLGGKAFTNNDSVARDENDMIIADEISTYGDSLCNTLWSFLASIRESCSKLRAIAQCSFEQNQILLLCDNEEVSNTYFASISMG